MPRLFFAPSALADLQGIGDTISADDPIAAGRFIEKVKKICGLIADQPHIGRVRNEISDIDRREIRSFPVGRYVVFYCSTKRGVEVLYVIHGARDLKTALVGSGVIVEDESIV